MRSKCHRVGDRPPRMMRQRDLAAILEPRARELMELLRDNLRHAGVLDDAGRRHHADRRRSAAEPPAGVLRRRSAAAGAAGRAFGAGATAG